MFNSLIFLVFSLNMKVFSRKNILNVISVCASFLQKEKVYHHFLMTYFLQKNSCPVSFPLNICISWK